MLNIYDLHKKRFQRDAQRNAYYKKILHKCYQRIVNVSNNCGTQCFFKIPEFLLGMPIYNKKECAKYLILALRENGFDVKIAKNLILYISWEQIPESHYPDYKEQLLIKDRPKKQETNKSNYRNIYDTDSNNKLLYSNKLLNNLENKMRDVLK